MKLTRREFIKANAVVAAAGVAGMAVPGAQAIAQSSAKDGVRWDKGVCRYCGTGCGVLVGVKDGRVVATQGDPDAPVNKGLACVKGYFLAKIMYGKDRLTQPLLRMKPTTAEAMQWRALGSRLLERKPALNNLAAA